MTQKLWTPPRLNSHRPGEEERRVTWLELFYDLVYVATLIQLGDALSTDVSIGGFLRFATVFIPVWWAWTGITFYINRFIVDDLLHRLLIFAQIVAIAVLGVSVAGAFGDLAGQFALSYAVIRLILIALYVRTWRHVPQTQPLTARYVVAFSIGTGIWLVSAFLPQPLAAMLWLAAVVVEFGVIISPRTQALHALLPPDPPHMRERYGIFVIIVLGESFIKTISASSGTSVNFEILLFSVLGIFVTLGLWWLYFDDAEDSALRGSLTATYVWIYSHLPLTMGLTAFGVAAKKVFQSTGEPYVHHEYIALFCSALALVMVALATIAWALEHAIGAGRWVRVAARLVGAASFVLLMDLPMAWEAITFIMIVALLIGGQMAIDESSLGRKAAQPVESRAAD